MLDPRLTKLADVFVNYSVKAQPGENILIEAYGIDSALVKEIVKKVHAAGAHPFVNLSDHAVIRRARYERYGSSNANMGRCRCFSNETNARLHRCTRRS